MAIFFIVIGDFIIKCVSGTNIGTACVLTSPLVFGGLVAAGALELIFELKGVITIFTRKSKDGED